MKERVYITEFELNLEKAQARKDEIMKDLEQENNYKLTLEAQNK